MHNNWDVNALGTIYEQATRWSVFTGFDRLIALPLQMEDFDAAHDTRYFRDAEFAPSSGHVSNEFRDMARFGLLYLRHGLWTGNKQIIPASWVEQSITSLLAGRFDGGIRLSLVDRVERRLHSLR